MSNKAKLLHPDGTVEYIPPRLARMLARERIVRYLPGKSLTVRVKDAPSLVKYLEFRRALRPEEEGRVTYIFSALVPQRATRFKYLLREKLETWKKGKGDVRASRMVHSRWEAILNEGVRDFFPPGFILDRENKAAWQESFRPPSPRAHALIGELQKNAYTRHCEMKVVWLTHNQEGKPLPGGCEAVVVSGFRGQYSLIRFM